MLIICACGKIPCSQTVSVKYQVPPLNPQYEKVNHGNNSFVKLTSGLVLLAFQVQAVFHVVNGVVINLSYHKNVFHLKKVNSCIHCMCVLRQAF